MKKVVEKKDKKDMISELEKVFGEVEMKNGKINKKKRNKVDK